MKEHLDEPFLIIKTAWGGKGLLNDFRPPSATEGEGETGDYYTEMMEGIRKVSKKVGRSFTEGNEENEGERRR